MIAIKSTGKTLNLSAAIKKQHILKKIFPFGVTRLAMETLPFQRLFQLPCAIRSPRFAMERESPGDAATNNVQYRYHPKAVKSLPRRVFLQFIGLNPILYLYPAIAAPMQEMKEAEVIRILKLPSGVRIQEVIEGDGPEARDGDLVEVNYVCRRSNGYFVHSTVNQFSGESMPVILPLDENQIIEGLKEVLVGMKVGGKRRALIPPSVGYVNESLKPIPDEFGPRRSLLSHANEPLVFEVQLLKVL